jgi:hypothetical protein
MGDEEMENSAYLLGFAVLFTWAVFVGLQAKKKNRSLPGFIAMSVVLSPLIGQLVVSLIKPKSEVTSLAAGAGAVGFTYGVSVEVTEEQEPEFPPFE